MIWPLAIYLAVIVAGLAVAVFTNVVTWLDDRQEALAGLSPVPVPVPPSLYPLRPPRWQD